MRLPWTRWQSTLNKLGLKIVWGKRSQTPRKVPTRHSQLEKLEGREMMASQINNLHFINDTGTVGDGQSSDIRIGGYVSFTGSYMGQTLKVEFDHNNDGNIDGYVNASYMGTPFEYNPRTADSSLNSFTGSLPMRVRVEELDSMGQSLSVGSWISFPITVLAPEPEIDVQDPGPYGMSNTSLPDNTGSVSFGTTAQGTSVNKTLNIKNLGQGPLNVNLSSFSLPAGFTLVTPPSSTIAAGSYSSFVIRMDATSPGSPSGVMTFTSNDSDEATYHISLSGTVTGLSFSVNNLQLVTDNGYSSTDKVTSVPTVTGSVSYTGSYSGGTIRVEFDHNNDGAMEGYVNASPSMPFQYDPRNAQPSLSTYNGTFTLRYRVVVLDMMSQPTYTGSWSSFVMTLENNSQPVLDVQDASNSTSIANNTGSVSFGTVNQGTSVTKSFTIRNTGGATMTVNVGSFSLPAGFVLATSPSSTVAANGGTTTFSVRMEGTTAGSKSGRLTFTTNSTTATYDIGLSGTVNALSFSVNNLALINDTWINGDYITSDPRVTGTVTQTGSFSGSRIDVEFDHNSDGVKEGAVTYVSTGMSWQYDPRSVDSSLANFSGNFPLRYRVVAYDTMSQVVYTGSWASFPITLDNTPQPEIEVLDSGAMSLTSGSGSVYFGSTTQGTPLTKTFTIRNTGPGALTINTSSLSVPSGFTLVTPPAATVNANGGTTTFTVRMDATNPGTSSGAITFTNSDADEGTFSFSVSGTVNASLAEVDLRDSSGNSLAVNATYNLGNATIGQSVTKTLTIFNSGTGSLTIGTPTLSGSSAFSIVSSPMATVSPGSSTTVTIQFTPNLSGQVNGTLTFATNDADENPYVCNLVATGAAAPSAIVIGDMRLVSDTGTSSTDRVTSDPRLTGTIPLDANLSGGRVSIEFDHHGYGTASGNIQAYSPGEVFTYNPAQAEPSLNSYLGALDLKYRTVLYNSQGQAVASSSWVSYPITLEAAAAPKLVLTAGTTTILAQVGSFDFGTTPQGTPVDQVFTIRNTGTSNLAINLSSFQVPAGFTLVALPASSVAPSADTTFTVRMNATALGMSDGNLSFTSNDVDHASYSFRIHGDTFLNTSILEVRKSSGQLVASGATLDLGSAYVGQSLTQTLTILNTGAAALNLDTLQMSAGMTVVTPFSGSVAPYGGSTTLTVRYSAAAAGSVVGSLSFNTNDPQRPTYQLQWLAETLDPAAGSSTTVTGLRLAFDSGSSDTDKQTYDPRLVGRLGAIVTGGTVEVQFDHNADGVAEGFALVAANGSDFTYDPRGCQPTLSSYVGNVSLNYRAVLKDAGGSVLRTGAWQTFGFELVAKPTIPNLEISQLVLLQDSGSSNNDHITTNPTLYGVVRGTVTTGVARVEFDHNADGIADGHVDVTPGEAFTYDPRDSEPAYANRLGAQVLGYRLLKIAADGSVEATGAWDAIGLTLVAPPVSQITVGSLTLVHDDGGSTTSAPEILATQSGLVHEAISSDMLQLEVDINGDGLADDRVETTEGSTNYTYIPTVDSYGAKTLHFRFREWSSSLGTYLYGPWSSIAFTVVPAPAGSITDLKLTNDTGSSDTDKVSLDGTVEGKLNGSLIAYQTIHVDLNGDNVDELTTTTDENGNFSFDTTSLVAGAVTARVRASRVDAISNATVFGPWASFAYTLESAALPTLPALTLLQDTGTAGDLVTSNPTVTGQIVTTQQKSGVLIQFDLNNSGVVTGQALTDDMGQFTYRPLNLAAGAVTVRARVAVANAQGVTQFGPWTGVSYTFEIPNAVASTITNLGLVHATGGTAGNVTTTSDPAISGVAHDGLSSAPFAAGVIIEVDQNNDGQVDAQTITNSVGKFQYVPVGLSNGSQTIQVRAKTWDYKNHTLIAGAWQAISFQLAPKVNAAPVLSSLGLLADTGSSQTDLVTANSMLVGQATNDGSAADLTIELDTTGDSVADSLAYTGTDGSFTYSPVGLGFGTHTVRARAIEWDEAGGQYLFSPWKELTFIYENAVNTAAQIVDFHVAPGIPQSGPAVSLGQVGPALRGRVINEQYLAGITVEFDWNSDNQIDLSTTTDRLGYFQVATVVAMGTVRARTREMDASTGQVLYSSWSTLDAGVALSQDAPPSVTAFGQAVTVPQTNVVLAGSVANDNGVNGLIVQFDNDGDGVIDDSVKTDAQGNFVYSPQGLETGSVTVRARARETDANGITQVGAWRSFTFDFVDPALQLVHIDSVSLFNDSGASGTDHSTADPTVTGHVANAVAGTFVEFDSNDDGIADGSVLVNAQGNFQFTPVNLVEGYTTIAVRVQDSSQGQDWKPLNFVFSAQPDSSHSQALVSTYQTFNSNWETAQSTYRLGLKQIEKNYRISQQNAEEAYQNALRTATGTRDQVVEAARSAYNAVLQSAQQTYSTAINAASAQLATNLSSYTGDKTTYQPLDLSVSSPAPDNRLAIPADGDQPTAPTLESGLDTSTDIPNYDFANDQEYQDKLALYAQEYNEAVRQANSDYNLAVKQLDEDYDTAIAPFKAAYDTAIKKAESDFKAERDRNAAEKERLFDIKGKSDKTQKAIAEENKKYEKLSDSIRSRYVELQAARSAQYWNVERHAIDQKLETDSSPLNEELISLNYATAAGQTRYQEIQDKLREYQKTHDTGIADAEILYKYDMSTLAKQQATAIAEAKMASENKLTDLRADFDKEVLKANAWDDEKRLAAEDKRSKDQLAATIEFKLAKVGPSLDRANGILSEKETRDIKVSDAKTDQWLKKQRLQAVTLEAWSNALDTPGSRYQLSMAQNAASFAEKSSVASKTRTQADIRSVYGQQRAENEKVAALLSAAIGMQATERANNISSYTALRIAALPAHYGDGSAPLTGRGVDLVEERRLHGKIISQADADYSKAQASNLEHATDSRSYDAWVAATAIAEAKSKKENTGSVLQGILDGIAKQNELDDVTTALEEKKNAAQSKLDWQTSRTTENVSNDKAIASIHVSWNKKIILAKKGYDEEVATHAETFENAFAVRWKQYAEEVNAIEESSSKEITTHAKTFTNSQSGFHQEKSAADTKSGSTFREAMVGRWVSFVQSWAQSIQTRWSAFQEKLAETYESSLEKNDDAQEEYVDGAGAIGLSVIGLVNTAIKKSADKDAEAIKKGLDDEDVEFKSFLANMATARKDLAFQLAADDATDSSTEEDLTLSAANAISDHWSTRSNSGVTARYDYEVSAANAEATQSRSRINDRFELNAQTISQSTFDARRLIAVNATISTLVTAEGTRRAVVAASEVKHATDNLESYKVWLLAVDNLSIQNAEHERDSVSAFLTTWKNKADLLSAGNATAFEAYQKALAKSHRDKAVETDEIETESMKSSRTATDDLGGLQDDANDQLREELSEARSDYEVSLYSDHRDKLALASDDGLSGPMLRQNAYEQAAANADVSFSQSSKVARIEFEESISAANGEGGEGFDNSPELDDQLAEDTELADTRLALTERIAEIRKTRTISEANAATKAYRTGNIAALDANVLRLQALLTYDTSLTTAQKDWNTAVVGAEKDFYLALPISRPEVATENLSLAPESLTPISATTPALVAMRQAKQTAANAYSEAEFAAAKKLVSDLADADISEALGLKSADVTESTEVGEAATGATSSVKTATDADKTAETAVLRPHHTAQRGYAQAEADYSRGLQQNQGVAIDAAVDALSHAVNVATVTRATALATAAGTLMAGQKADDASRVVAASGGQSIEGSTALAAAQWYQSAVPAYAAWVHDVVAANVAKSEAITQAYRAQKAADTLSDNAKIVASRPSENLADDSRFSAERTFEESESQATSEQAVEETTAQATYETAMLSAADQEEVDRLIALKQKLLANLKPIVFVGPFVNILDFSDNGKNIDSPIATGPESGSDGYPTDSTSSGSSGSGTGGTEGGVGASSTGSGGGSDISPEKAEEIAISQAVLTRATSEGAAAIAWVNAVSASRESRAHKHEDNLYDQQVDFAVAKRDLAKTIAPLEESRLNAFAQSQAAYWTAETNANNQERMALTIANNAWEAAQYLGASVANASIAADMSLPWTDFQASRAAAKYQWWLDSGAEEALNHTAALNTADSQYQAARNANYVELVHENSLSKKNEVIALADGAYQKAVDDLFADKEFETAVATLEKLWQVGNASQAANNKVVGLQINKQFVISGDDSGRVASLGIATSSAIDAAIANDQLYDSGYLQESNDHADSVEAHRTAYVALQNSAVQATKASNRNAAFNFAVGEALAQEAVQVAYAVADAASNQAVSLSWSTSLSQLAQSTPSPWATFDAEQMVGKAAFTVTVYSAYVAEKQAIAQADRVFAVAVANAQKNQDADSHAGDSVRYTALSDAQHTFVETTHAEADAPSTKPAPKLERHKELKPVQPGQQELTATLSEEEPEPANFKELTNTLVIVVTMDAPPGLKPVFKADGTLDERFQISEKEKAAIDDEIKSREQARGEETVSAYRPAELERYINNAEIQLKVAKELIALIQQLQGSPATTHEQFVDVYRRTLIAVDEYQHARLLLEKAREIFTRSQWYTSDADRALYVRINYLPPSITIPATRGFEVNEKYGQDLMKQIRAVSKEDDNNEKWLGNAEWAAHAVKAVGYSAAVVLVAIVILPALPGIAGGTVLWVGGTMAQATIASTVTTTAITAYGAYKVKEVANGVHNAALERIKDPDNFSDQGSVELNVAQAYGQAVVNMSFVGQMYSGATNRDIFNGKELGLSEEETAKLFGQGSFQVFMLGAGVYNRYSNKPAQQFGQCFPAGTLVSCESGSIPIEDIQIGTRVWGYDLASRDWHLLTVEETYRRNYDHEMVQVTVSGDGVKEDEVIESTLLHPFWVVSGEDLADRPTHSHHLEGQLPENGTTPGRWVDAVDLQVGDILLLQSGYTPRIASLSRRLSPQVVFNLSLPPLRCYAVGKLRVLVHNQNGFEGGTTAADRIANRTMTKSEWKDFYRTLRTEARQGAADLAKLPRAHRGPVVSAVIDARTGKTFSAGNTGVPSNSLHPILKERLNVLNNSIDNSLLRENSASLGRWVFSEPGAHAEVNALNQALWARQNAGMTIDLNEFWMVNRWRTNSASGVRRCGFCRPLTDGINVLTD